MDSQKFEYFFDLPPELREQILCHLCLFPTGILVGAGEDGLTIAIPSASPLAVAPHASHPPLPVSDQDDQEEYAGPPLDVFLASPVLYREAGDIYYGRNVFHVEFVSLSGLAWGRLQRWNGHPLMHDQMALFNERGTAGARRRIRQVVLHLKRFGGVISEVAAPALEDMVLNGSLRRLRVDVREGWAGFQIPTATDVARVRRMDHTANPGLRGLLAVLADPDMEKAELRAGDEFLEMNIPQVVEACAGNAAEFHITRVRVG
ncbi:hypothetical protein N0V88_003937 [Collariella sp. IMI 366227]|nr:hypothetical protein N0V88_003937 [Collariella sp. IMI 366227]